MRDCGVALSAIPAALAILAVMAGGPARADSAGQPMSHDAMHTAHTASGAGPIPVSPGQDAFGAIQEIVAILEADPMTDWERVDLTALHRHLVEMNALMLDADFVQTDIPGGLEITVNGAGRAGEAARHMIPAHARELGAIDGWDAAAEIVAGGSVTLRVVARDATKTAHIRGLGFVGLMVTGAHHQEHHLALARGLPMHR